ncbi:hypothetical protein V6N12_062593 [Hibiscus sabdariffa]|uniref:Uncharacterized protein n=1 Tax=Hibiscus sabdariffa TaxID=183260 RepID=A0ABR2F9B2_9ROSI
MELIDVGPRCEVPRAERCEAKRRLNKKGRGRPRKKPLPEQGIANASLSDPDFMQRQQDSGSPTMEDEHSIEWEKEAFNELFIGKDYSAIKGQDIGNIDRHIGESDLLGVNCMDALNKGGCAVVGDEFGVLPLETATLSEDRGCLEALEPNVCCKSPVQAALVSPNFKASEDAHIIGLSRELADKALDKSITEKVRAVDQFPLADSVNVVNGASFFPEMDHNCLGGCYGESNHRVCALLCF